MKRILEIPVGKRSVRMQMRENTTVVSPRVTTGVADVSGEIARALRQPIGSERLVDIARGKKTAAIVVNDITRPYPGGQMVREIAKELRAAGIADADIRLVIAYGYHRKNTRAELVSMLGEEVVDRFAIVHHDAQDETGLTMVGMTPRGVPVKVNTTFVEADVRITTGLIAPHQIAGFSGGRKSILPGISGIDTLKKHHSFPIRAEVPIPGQLEGNAFHEEAVAAARLAGVDFIVNSVDNDNKEMVACVAGDLEAAFMEGAAISRRLWSVEIGRRADIVVVSPGGYPRDFDLHQAQKAVGCAEMLVRPGGGIILVAEMPDGAGKPGKLLAEANDPQEIIERFRVNGFQPDATSKAFMWARALVSHRITIAESVMDRATVERMGFRYEATLEDALENMLEIYGANAVVYVVPNASEILPVYTHGDGAWKQC